jgi:hypothetical protein
MYASLIDEQCSQADPATAPECACVFRNDDAAKIDILGDHLSFNGFKDALQANFGLDGIDANASIECWWPPCQKGNTTTLRPPALDTCPANIDVCIALIENANADAGGTLHANCTMTCPPTGTGRNSAATNPTPRRVRATTSSTTGTASALRKNMISTTGMRSPSILIRRSTAGCHGS